MQNPIIEKNKFGYYEVKDKPSVAELKQYYAEKYYQLSTSKTYQQNYSHKEIAYINNKLEQKYLAAISFLCASARAPGSFLDVGAGEGWALAHMKAKGWQCTGLDYSEYGCRAHNPNVLAELVVGDIYDKLDGLVSNGRCFDLVLLDNVLEHVVEPLELLTKIHNLLVPGGVLIIEVPNDFSVIQEHLLAGGHVSRAFWVGVPDHLSYFNRHGLVALGEASGWSMRRVLGDFPIDFFLCHEATNYVENKAVGKSCHQARVELENLMHTQSPEKTNALYEALADLGLGRVLIGFFQRKIDSGIMHQEGRSQ